MTAHEAALLAALLVVAAAIGGILGIEVAGEAGLLSVAMAIGSVGLVLIVTGHVWGE